MTKLKRYPEYKASGIEWIGDVPSGWEVKLGKYLFSLAKRPPQESDGIVTAFRDGMVTLRTNRRTTGFTNALKEIGYQGVKKNDLVIHAMDAFAGAVGVSDSDGKCSPVYLCCTPLQNVYTPFYARLVRTMALSGYIESLAKGIRERSTDFRWGEFSIQALVFPSLPEQQAIADFLDRETAHIDKVITKKTRLIELLKEKRQATITHAVTKGLDPQAKMKDSGVEWIGEVPEGWEVKQVKRIATLNPPRGKVSISINPQKASFIPMEKVAVDWSNTPLERPFVEICTGYTYFQDDDILVAKITPCFENGKGTIVTKLNDGFGFGSTEFHVIRVKCKESIKFLSYILRTKEFIQFGKYEMTGVAGQQRVPESYIASLCIPLPPVPEQQAIADYLDKQCAAIDAIITKTQRSIELLKEKRQALITAAVTGQIDVRSW